MTTPDTEKLSQDSIEHTLKQVINLTASEILKQMLEEIKTMTDFNPQDRWEAGFDEAIAAVVTRMQEKIDAIEKHMEN